MKAHLISANKTDLEVGLGYLRISKSINDMGDVRQARGVHLVTVSLTKPFNSVQSDLSARFGRFLQLRHI
jgi:hypothetical protein